MGTQKEAAAAKSADTLNGKRGRGGKSKTDAEIKALAKQMRQSIKTLDGKIQKLDDERSASSEVRSLMSPGRSCGPLRRPGSLKWPEDFVTEGLRGWGGTRVERPIVSSGRDLGGCAYERTPMRCSLGVAPL